MTDDAAADRRDLRAAQEAEYDRIFRPADPVDDALKCLVAEEKAKRAADKVRADPELSAQVEARLAEIVGGLDSKTQETST